MKPFEIKFLDHVAIRVKDLELSVQWYEKVFALKQSRKPEWGDFMAVRRFIFIPSLHNIPTLQIIFDYNFWAVWKLLM